MCNCTSGNLEIPGSYLSMRPGMTVSPPERRVRIAPGDEFRHDKAFAASPELHVIALGVGDLAAGRGDERVSSGDVPFAGRAEAGIDVGSPLRHPAELNRGAELLPDRAGPRLNESFGPDVSMRAADRRDPWVAAFRQRAGMNRLGYGNAAKRGDPWIAAFRQRAGMNRLGYGPVRCR